MAMEKAHVKIDKFAAVVPKHMCLKNVQAVNLSVFTVIWDISQVTGCVNTA